MLVKTIKASYTFTKNLGNYESLKVQGGVEIEVYPNTDLEQASQEAYAMAMQQVNEGLEQFTGKKKAPAKKVEEAPKKEAPKKEAPTKKEAPKKEEEALVEVSLNELKALAGTLLNSGHEGVEAKLKSILDEFGFARVSEVAPEQSAAFADRLKALGKELGV